MAFSLGTLTNYVDEINGPFIIKSIFGAETASLINSQTGIKTTENIHISNTDAVFQDGAGCGFNSSGTTAITESPITVGKVKIEEALCPDDLNAKFTQIYLKAGSDNDTDMGVISQLYLEEKAQETQAAVETAIWQGDTAGGAQLNRFDGLLKLIDAGSPIDGNPTAITVAVGITAANVEGIVNGIYALIPADILNKDDVLMFVGYDVYRTWTQALTTSNLFHYTAESTDFSLTIPGTNIKVKAVHGLNGTDRIITARTSSLYVGTDLDNEFEQFKFEYAPEADEWRYSNKFKMGTGVVFTDLIVEFTLVP